MQTAGVLLGFPTKPVQQSGNWFRLPADVAAELLPRGRKYSDFEAFGDLGLSLDRDGQVPSRNKLADRWHWNRDRVSAFLKAVLPRLGAVYEGKKGRAKTPNGPGRQMQTGRGPSGFESGFPSEKQSKPYRNPSGSESTSPGDNMELFQTTQSENNPGGGDYPSTTSEPADRPPTPPVYELLERIEKEHGAAIPANYRDEIEGRLVGMLDGGTYTVADIEAAIDRYFESRRKRGKPPFWKGFIEDLQEALIKPKPGEKERLQVARIGRPTVSAPAPRPFSEVEIQKERWHKNLLSRRDSGEISELEFSRLLVEGWKPEGDAPMKPDATEKQPRSTRDGADNPAMV